MIPPLGNSANCELHRGGAIGDILERISCDRWICLQARAFDLKMGRARDLLSKFGSWMVIAFGVSAYGDESGAQTLRDMSFIRGCELFLLLQYHFRS